MSTTRAKALIDDKTLERLLTVVSHYVFAELEELTPFDSLSKLEQETIMKVAVRTIETSVVVSSELYSPNAHLNEEKIEKMCNLLQAKQYNEANDTLKEVDR